jgi:tetratricopeptide (TPR) repeat protein/predicted esterase
LTRSGDFTGTPYYVSPEQSAARPGEIDRRTDVYSLGVTLYELLALRRPFEGPNSVRVLRRIQSGEPVPLRKLNPAVPRDLETICATAMERSPDRRYPSMEELARDIRAFLAFKPVRAKPAGVARRLARRMRGNPLLSAVLALGVIVALGVPIGLLWANALIREQRDRASDAASQARGQALLSAAQNDFLVGLFELAESRPDDAAAAIELLDRGVERLNQRNDLEPLARAALLEAAARGYSKLGRDDRALPLFDRAFAIRHRELGENHVDVARLLCELASVHLRERNAESALALAQRGAAAFESCGAGRTLEAARCHRVCGDAALELRNFALAQIQFDAALHALHALPDAGDELALVHEGLGEFARLRGQLEAASERYGYALALHRARSSPDAKAIARTLERLAAVDEARGRDAAAFRRRAEATELLRANGALPAAATTAPREPAPIDFAPPWRAEFEREFQAGITALQTGAHAQAIEHFARCRELSPRQPVAAYNIACAHALAGETDAALTWLATAVDDGFGYSDERFEIARKDADLGRLRADPRFALLLERMVEQRAAASAYAAEPASYVPASAAPERGWPVLIVLHDHGSTKDDVLRGPWRAVADELGAVLLAPSGSIPTAVEPSRGMAWVEDLAAFVEAPPAIEQRVRAALDTASARLHVDLRNVLVAGEGHAAPVAFDLAVRAPGVFHGVLLHDGPPHVGAASESLRTAASIGLAVGVALDADARVPGAGAVSTHELAGELSAWLASHEFRAARVIELARGDDSSQLAALARAMLR